LYKYIFVSKGPLKNSILDGFATQRWAGFVWSFAVMKHSTPAQSSTAARWKIQSEFRNLNTDILSARCIVDRLLVHSDALTIAQMADRDDLKRLVANMVAIADFVRSIAEADPERPSAG
jgi:hypothetical protein